MPPHPPLPCWRVRPDEATSKRRSTAQRKTTLGSTQAAPHCASGTKAALPRPRRESARFPQPSMGSRSARRSLRNGAWVCLCLHRCERRQAVRPASIDGTARASTVQCAPPPAADHSSDLGCSRNGAANTYTNRSARLARVGRTCVRPLHPHAVHRAAEAGATHVEHAWSHQHCETTKPPFSQADRACRSSAAGRTRAGRFARGSGLKTAAHNSKLGCAVGRHCRKSRRLHRTS